MNGHTPNIQQSTHRVVPKVFLGLRDVKRFGAEVPELLVQQLRRDLEPHVDQNREAAREHGERERRDRQREQPQRQRGRTDRVEHSRGRVALRERREHLARRRERIRRGEGEQQRERRDAGRRVAAQEDRVARDVAEHRHAALQREHGAEERHARQDSHADEARCHKKKIEMALLAEIEELLAASRVYADGDVVNANAEMQSLDEMRHKILQKCESDRDPRWLLAHCHVVENIVWRRVVPTEAQWNGKPSSHAVNDPVEMDKRSVVILETAVMSAYYTLQRVTNRAQSMDAHDATMEDVDEASAFGHDQLQLQGAGATAHGTHVISAYSSVFECALSLLRTDGGDDDELGNGIGVAADIMSRFGVLLSVCWLMTDGASALPRAIDLLSIAVRQCEKHRETRQHAKSALFLLGMLHFVEKRDYEQALTYFREATMLEKSSLAMAIGADESGGVFHYWFAVALYKNGCFSEATTQLQCCLRCNYVPVSSLNLSAFLYASDNDFHAAALDLQRALELDFLESVSIFNYAVLLGEMHNFVAQQQILEYYEEAVHPEGDVALEKAKRTRSGTPRSKDAKSSGTSDGSASWSLFSKSRLAALFAPHEAQVTREMTNSQMAYAAMENGKCCSDWQRSKQYFEELLAAYTSAPTAQNNLPSMALEKCEHLLASLRTNVKDEAEYLVAYLYKADALLSLERVRECHEYLTQTVEPKISNRVLLLKQQPHPSTEEERLVSNEITACHIQLLNNLAVATACQDSVDAAISILRRGVDQYPYSLSLKFNLVLLLWRSEERKDAACSIWLEARGLCLHMDMGDMGDDQKAREMVTAAEDAAIMAATRTLSHISEHVQRGEATQLGSGLDDNDGISSQQLLYLDALVLNHWGKIRSASAIETSVKYVQYLDSLSAAAATHK
ncbi:hypothetical protein FI667_g7239, partial [Globisporangium splendens]